MGQSTRDLWRGPGPNIVCAVWQQHAGISSDLLLSLLQDPTLTGSLGAAYVAGMQDPKPGVWPAPAVRNVVKHFAAYNLESNFAGRTTPSQIAKGDGQYR